MDTVFSQLYALQTGFGANIQNENPKTVDKSTIIRTQTPVKPYGEPVLGLYKNNFINFCAKNVSNADKKEMSTEEHVQNAIKMLEETGRHPCDTDKSNLSIIFKRNADAVHFYKSVISARDGAFSPADVNELLYTLRLADKENFEELLNTDDGKLSAREITGIISAAVNSDNPEQIEKLKPFLGLKTATELVNHRIFICRYGLLDRFDEINTTLFGEKPDEIKEAEEKFFKKYNVYPHLDYNVSPKNLDMIEESVQTLQQSGLKMPSHIYITNFAKTGTSGGFSRAYPDSVLIVPFENKNSLKERSLLHEFVHMNKYLASGAKTFHGEELPAEVKENACKNVSRYSTTNTEEFLAEVGTLLLQGKIKIDLENSKICYKKEYQNHDGKQVSPAPSEIAELIEYYFNEGGQDFKSPAVKLDESFATAPLEL